MIVFSSKLEKDTNSKTLEAIFDIEGYEGVEVQPYHRYMYNLNQKHTYRLDFDDKVLFWENGKIVKIPSFV